MTIHAFIFSWKGHEAHTVELQEQIERFYTVTVINSDERLKEQHPEWIHLDDSAYFSSQWNKAKDLFVGDLLFHIQADVVCDNFAFLFERVNYIFERFPVGVYEPDIDFTDFRYNRSLLPRIERDLYEVPRTDCTCWCLGADILRELPTVDVSINKFGWGISAAIAAICKRNKKVCVRDYAVAMKHPRGRGYSTESAVRHRNAYFETLPADLRKGVAHVYQEFGRVRLRDDAK